MEDKILKLLQDNFTMLNEKIDNNTRAITTLNEKVDIINDKLDVINNEKYLAYMDMLNEINESIDFLKYENLKSRQDLFIVKKRIQDKVKG